MALAPNTSLLQRLKHSRDLLYIVILALVVAIVWIVLSVYHSSVQTTVPANIQSLTVPLNPTINTQLIQSLSNRTVYTSDELSNFPINRAAPSPLPGAPVASAAPTQAPLATPTPLPSSSPASTATPSPTPAVSPSPTASPVVPGP
jgi:hypothetical protein